MQRLLFNNNSPLIRTTQEEAAHLIFGCLFSLGGNFNDIMSTERGCRIMKRALGLISIIDNLAGSTEERISDILNHMSNQPIFRLNICVDFSPQN